MKQQITYIKGKNLGTKSIDDLVLMGYFETSIKMYEQLHKYFNKIMKLEIEDKGNTIELQCKINTDTKNTISFVEDHGMVKLDIIVPDILLAGYIISGNIFLTLDPDDKKDGS